MDELILFVNRITDDRWSLILTALGWGVSYLWIYFMWRMNRRLSNGARIQKKLDEMLDFELNRYEVYIKSLSVIGNKFRNLGAALEGKDDEWLDEVKTSVMDSSPYRDLFIFRKYLGEEDKEEVREYNKKANQAVAESFEVFKKIKSLGRISEDEKNELLSSGEKASKAYGLYASILAEKKNQIIRAYYKSET